MAGSSPAVTGWGSAPAMAPDDLSAGAGATNMLQGEGAEASVKVEFDNFEHGFPEGFGPGGWGYLAYAIGLAFALFQLYVAAIPDLPSQVVRGVHAGFLTL